jgi:hypothetical protein
MEQALEDVGAFSELRRGCEGLCKAASRARRSRGAFAALDETNSANAGVVPKRNCPFPFLQRKVEGRGMVGRDWRTNGFGKTEEGGRRKTAWNRGPEESKRPWKSEAERGGRQNSGGKQ